MVVKMDEIAKKRAEIKGDSREWTALDCLEDLISEIKEGKVNPKKMVIHFLHEENETEFHHYSCAGVTYQDHIAILNLALKRVLEEWML
jgi:hypothetical protein